MRWLLISRQHHPSHGGIGTYVRRFAEAARRQGWHLELMTQPGRHLPECAAVHEVTTPDMCPDFESRLPDLRRRHVVRPYRYALWSTAVAERLLCLDDRFEAIEFVDCQAEGFASLGCPAVRRRHPGAAFIVHAHTPMFVEEAINNADASAFGRPMYHDWERRAMRAADGVIVTAGVLGAALTDIAPSTMIPYPIQEKHKCPTMKRDPRIVLVGSVQPRKGGDVWARSLNQVLQAKPQVSALLIGPDTLTAPEGLSMVAHVQRLIDPRFSDRFRWQGSLSHEQVRETIATSSLVVVPSCLESFSFVAAESLLAGTPVIVSDRTGIAEHVPSLPRVASEDVEALARAQLMALTDLERASSIAAKCRTEMLQACAPSRVLAMRAAMIADTRRRRHPQPASAGDTLKETKSFIAAVDAAESSRSTAFASSATS